MIEQEETNIAVNAILISTHNEFILQERDDKPGIVNPGMWCLFGGSVKANETNWSAMRRELFEELELTYTGAQVEVFKTFKKNLETDGKTTEVHIYIIKDIDLRKLVLHEGKSLIIDRLDSILENKDNITRISALALTEYKQYKKL